MTRRLPDEAAMIDLGREIAAGLHRGDVLALVGPLGAGKTHFSKGIVAGLGGRPDGVTSPTFTLVHEYAAGCRLPVYHFDFYRLESAGELSAIGWEDYLDEAAGVMLVEWADKFPEMLPPHARWWRFAIADDGSRLVTGGDSDATGSDRSSNRV
ncbi:MAG: tRNA (adenosine(37)-N6)-threonylcarbamoyltransferase complex ATPase subunit type 1 TsaE [Verrucomicrobiales bacterium]|nr:tRNA (adenosine(37)-N6)-threonylcarbamoyltransferase complex ATPase subunit type 1 TsaE [Verrucomicrobiales bacterium]